MKTLYRILCIVVIISGIGGCSMIGGLFGGGNEPSDSDKNYREAVKALEEKKYKKSSELVREIEPDSPVYSKGLQLLQQIPLQKAQDAIEAKDYPMALSELNKISEGNSNYAKAKELKEKMAFMIALNEYEKARQTPQRMESLERLATVAIESKNSPNLMRAIDIIGDHLNQSNRPEEIETYIMLLESTIENQHDTDVVYAGLEHSFMAYKQFNQEPDLRDQLLRLIAKLKMNLL
ncbi:MAG: hypothetical protein HQM13_05285 [SAR324 cluster bacterium]|nr:hypothetical protein [SAR324 cluster bacterium]